MCGFHVNSINERIMTQTLFGSLVLVDFVHYTDIHGFSFGIYKTIPHLFVDMTHLAQSHTIFLY